MLPAVSYHGTYSVSEVMYLIGCMIDHQIHHQFHIPFLEFSDQMVYIVQSTVSGIDRLVIGNIITHIHLRTF